MYSPLQIAFKYLNYYFTSSGAKGHGTHSPFVFDFISKVLNDSNHYEVYDKAEDERRKLLKDNSVLTVQDFGAGSSSTNSDKRTVASIAKHAVKSKKYGQLLYRMVKYYQPQTIFELGTSLGITTVYLAYGKPDAKVVTAEGSKEISEVARETFKTLKSQNIELIRGDFKYTLPMAIQKLRTIEFAFIDGNHQKEPTENYFSQLLEAINNNSILVFDDIHWSGEMEQAWEHIKQHEKVRCSIDLFFIGIVLFRKEFKEKQHFRIRF
jgi:predicted O-methyltransferase YrrM